MKLKCFCKISFRLNLSWHQSKWQTSLSTTIDGGAKLQRANQQWRINHLFTPSSLVPNISFINKVHEWPNNYSIWKPLMQNNVGYYPWSWEYINILNGSTPCPNEFLVQQLKIILTTQQTRSRLRQIYLFEDNIGVVSILTLNNKVIMEFKIYST